MIKSFSHSRSGFSILMALGTIGILLIIVVGLASVYIRELKLSRTSYNDIIASAGAEGAFEYGMLKVRNHREGFADSMSDIDPDGKMLTLSSPRSVGMKSSYIIRANSMDEIFALAPNEHLIIPLFASNEGTIPGSPLSRNPGYNPGVNKTTGLVVTGLTNLSWTIVAMNGSENVGVTGEGDITASKLGTLRIRGTDCYRGDGVKENPDSFGICPLTSFVHSDGTITQGEALDYFYDLSGRVSDFLQSDGTSVFNPEDDVSKQTRLNISNPYLMIYNNNPTEQEVHISASTPFSLPEMTIEATAQKNDSSQIFRFTEDKSRYYDALKYGVYNN